MLKQHFAYMNARFGRDEGATAVEYGIMVALIAVVIIAAVILIGQNLQSTFETVADCLDDPGGAGCPEYDPEG